MGGEEWFIILRNTIAWRGRMDRLECECVVWLCGCVLRNIVYIMEWGEWNWGPGETPLNSTTIHDFNLIC